MRLRCYLWGCTQDDMPACYYCGANLYTHEFRETGPLDWLTYRIRCLWRWLTTLPRCQHCEKSLLFRRRYKDDFCSKECFDSWIPF